MRNCLSFNQRYQIIEWIKRQPNNKFADRTAAAKIAAAELKFEVTTFNLSSMDVEFPGCLDRIVKRAPTVKTPNQKNGMQQEIQELKTRVAALESLVEMLANG